MNGYVGGIYAALPLLPPRVIYRDTALGATTINNAMTLAASSIAPFTDGSGTTICVHVSADFTKAVFVWPSSSDQLYEMSGGTATLIPGSGGVSLDGDIPGQIAIGSGAHLWTGDTGGNLNRYSYPGLDFEDSITATATNYGLAADGADNLYWWDYPGAGVAALRKRTIGGTQTTILSESDVGERRGIGFNPYDGFIYEYLDLGSTATLRRIDPSTGTPTDLTTLAAGGGSLQPCFTPDGGVWLSKRNPGGVSYDVYRWDIPGATLATSTAAEPSSGAALVPLLDTVLGDDYTLVYVLTFSGGLASIPGFTTLLTQTVGLAELTVLYRREASSAPPGTFSPDRQSANTNGISTFAAPSVTLAGPNGTADIDVMFTSSSDYVVEARHIVGAPAVVDSGSGSVGGGTGPVTVTTALGADPLIVLGVVDAGGPSFPAHQNLEITESTPHASDFDVAGSGAPLVDSSSFGSYYASMVDRYEIPNVSNPDPTMTLDASGQGSAFTAYWWTLSLTP